MSGGSLRGQPLPLGVVAKARKAEMPERLGVDPAEFLSPLLPT